MNFRRIIILSGILFTIHNIDEIWGLNKLKSPTISLPFALPDTHHIIWAIVLITIIAWIIICYLLFNNSPQKQRLFLTGITAMFLGNAIMPHILLSIWLKQLTPGVCTALLLYLPFCYWSLPKIYNLSDSPWQFFKASFLGIFISIALVQILHVTLRLV